MTYTVRHSMILGFLLAATNHLHADQHLHVAINGDDQAMGTHQAPLATLHEAQQRVRNWLSQEEATGPITVHVHAGTYRLTEPLLFTGEDAGRPELPITYRAEGQVILSGSVPLTEPNYQPSHTDLLQFPEVARQHIVAWDLRSLGLADQATFPIRSPRLPMDPASLQLLVGSSALPNACWPAAGWSQLSTQQLSRGVIALPHRSGTSAPKAGVVHGFFRAADEDDTFPVTWTHRSDSYEANLPSDENPIHEQARYRLLNVASQLDQPSEWYIDTEHQILFAWLPTSSLDPIVVPRLETLVSLYDVAHFHWEGFTLEAARVMGIEIAGGEHITIANCELRHFGNVGINVYYGHHHTITGCEIYECGSSALRVEGGDTASFTRGDHQIDHNQIHDFGRLYCGHRAGVELIGLGLTMQNNVVYNGPDRGIHIRGNDIVVERNEIHHVCQVANDTGAIYLGSNPTHRGNAVRHNYVHDLATEFDRQSPRHTDVIAIYLDDFASGTSVQGNVLRNTVRGIAIGGGRDNTVEHNVILESLAGVQVDCRGTTWAKEWISDEKGSIRRLVRQSLNDSPTLTDHYPELTEWEKDRPEFAKGNVIRFNVVDGINPVDLFDQLDAKVVLVENNSNRADDIFVNVRKNNFSLKMPTATGFQPLSIAQAGPSQTPLQHPATPAKNQLVVQGE